jgi:hypothetical protein
MHENYPHKATLLEVHCHLSKSAYSFIAVSAKTVYTTVNAF